jgi:hypothetical protein
VAARRPARESPPTTAAVVSSLPVLHGQVTGVPATLGPWILVGRTYVPGPFSDQGLATVREADDQTQIVYSGTLTVTRALRAEGWDHVGDPDGWNGWLVSPFQGDAGAKMFEVTAPSGAVTQAVHALVPGEDASNSFAAVTPDGQWTVSAEWGLERRLLVFPTPVINRSYATARNLPLAATITLQQPVDDLQGCAFATATSLVCTDADDLLDVELNRPVQPAAQLSAMVRAVGALPEVGGCQGGYEPEGVDIDRARQQLRIEISQPGICNALTQVYEYESAPTVPLR